MPTVFVKSVESGRTAFENRQWREAFERLSRAATESQLEPDDLVLLASAAYLAGREADATSAWTDAHNGYVERGQPMRAARCGFWLSLTSLLSGEGSRSAGWLARAQRELIPHPDCAEQGLVRIVAGLQRLGRDPEQAGKNFTEAVALAERHGDADLLAFGLLSRGQALIEMRKVDEGVALLDEAMATVISGVSPIVAGIVYCAVILTCQDILDIKRAREWTAALDAWCSAQPDMVAFRGKCLIHRSEILQLNGDWQDACAEARRACDWYQEREQGSSGRAFYQLAELYRLRGDLESANKMYEEAARGGVEPQPGLSLLRLAEGRVDAAAAAIRRVVGEAGDKQGPDAGRARGRVLGPYVEIMLACNDVKSAREGADELTKLAAEADVPFLVASAAEVTGCVLLAEGDAHAAVDALRRAWKAWQDIEASYESARVQALIGGACLQLGDADTAHKHLEAARAVFERLGAAPALALVDDHRGKSSADSAAELTAREREVLALLASGKTNRQIGETLHISEHTVARHVSNLFNKLAVSSRTAAAGYAHKHGLQ
jgi:DNA-binding CsgD family transcriptional regulator/Flp pilus assembly protein TadD